MPSPAPSPINVAAALQNMQRQIDQLARRPVSSGGGSARQMSVVSHQLGVLGHVPLPAATALSSSFGTFWSETLALNANVDVCVTASPDTGSFSTASLSLVKVADSGGAVISGGPSTSRTQSGSGQTAVSFPSFTPTADYTVPSSDSDLGLKVVNAGWYLAIAYILWDA